MQSVMEDWREHKQGEEFDAFIQEHFGGTIDEGFIDWVMSKGRDITDTVKGVISGMKDWTHDKIVQFVRYMTQKLEAMMSMLRRKGVLGKNRSRQEISALKLLRTNKHIDLAVLILSTIAKMTGGFIVDKVIKMPEIIEKILDILDNPQAALRELYGDLADIVDMIKKFIEFRKDKGKLAVALGNWADFGGLAENMYNEAINEDVNNYFNEILTEARFKDVKAKYSQYMGLVDSARDYIKGKLGDKGVSKYILYVMKETHRMMGEPETKMEVLDAGKDDIVAVMFNLIDLVEKFEKNVARLKEKDIYRLNANELEKLVDDLPTPESEEKRERRKKAREESDVLYNENDVLAVRPLTEFAATYYGMATRWCISATDCRNYFDQYTADGKAFAMVILRNLTPDDSDFYKAALVYDSDGEFESLFDGPDNEHYDTNGLRDSIALNHKRTGQNYFSNLDDEEQEEINDILDQIMGNASANIMDNPPDATEAYEAAAERIEEEFIDRIEHAHYYHEVMDGGHLYYSGGFEVSIETSRFDEPEHMKYLNYQEESEIADDIRSMLDRELSVYVNDVDIQSGDDETDFRMDIHAEGEATPDGYERYLEELAEYDSKYKGIVRVIELVLQKYDILPKGQLESFDEAAFERETENFSVIDRREYPGDEEIVLRSDREPIGMLLTPEQLEDLNFSTPRTTGSGRTYGYFNKSLSDRIAGKLSTINQKIAASLRKQLPLPGIPQEKIKELTIPEMLEVRIAGGGAKPGNSGEIKLVFQITVDDVKITKENFTMVLDIIKFIDQNYSEMVEVAKNTIKVFITQGLKARDAVNKEKAAAEKLAQVDSQDGTDPVNEYFSELIKTDLEKRIDRMTIKEWLDPECPAPWDEDYEDKK